MSIFDSKIWNPQVFDKYRETIPLIRTVALLASGAFRRRADWAEMFPEQSGGNIIKTPFIGRLDGDADNYDGETDMSISGIDTFMRDIVAIGRMKGWREYDFTQSISGKDFMPEIALQVNEWYDNQNVRDVLAILVGIFAMTGDLNLPFVNGHTHDLSAGSGAASRFDETTIITAAQKACGMNMSVFSIGYMHSFIVANLTKIMQVEYMKYTDRSGFTRNINMATVNGKVVFMDDRLYDAETGNYTTYLLGENAFDTTDLAVAKPSSVSRNEETAGGISKLHTRQRKVYAPNGISFLANAMGKASPERSELALGVNYGVVANSDNSKTIDHRAIPIARIITKG